MQLVYGTKLSSVLGFVRDHSFVPCEHTRRTAFELTQTLVVVLVFERKGSNSVADNRYSPPSCWEGCQAGRTIAQQGEHAARVAKVRKSLLESQRRRKKRHRKPGRRPERNLKSAVDVQWCGEHQKYMWHGIEYI